MLNQTNNSFKTPGGKVFPFIHTPDGSDKRRAKREAEAAAEAEGGTWTSGELLRNLAAEERGRTAARRAAEAREAERKAAEPQAPRNGAAIALQKLNENMARGGINPLSDKAMKTLKQAAKLKDAEIAAEAEAEQRRQDIANSESVKIATEHAALQLRAAQLSGNQEWIDLATENQAAASESIDTSYFWARAKELENLLYADAEAKAQTALAKKTAAVSEATDAMQRAVESGQRLDTSMKQPS